MSDRIIDLMFLLAIVGISSVGMLMNLQKSAENPDYPLKNISEFIYISFIGAGFFLFRLGGR